MSGRNPLATERGHQSRRRSVSRPGDAAEREADRAATVVARGGRVPDWSFSAVPTGAPVHRDGPGGDKAKDHNAEQYEKAMEKTGEAVLETDAAKKVKEKILELPPVKAAKDFAGTTPGMITIGAGLAGGVAALAATGNELPMQPPAIPLDLISPKLEGFSAKVTWKGPVAAPTEGGLVISYSPKGPTKKGPTDKDRFAAKTARMAESQRRFRESLKSPQQRAAEEDAMMRFVVESMARRSTFLPFDPTKKLEPLPGPRRAFVDPAAQQSGDNKKDDDSPVQRDVANPAGSAGETTEATPMPDGDEVGAHVDHALRTAGRPLDRPLRRDMEARFGVDFSHVRIHDDTRAAQASAGLDANAFTVDEHVVFGGGRFEPDSARGRHLLAHELAHVVQQGRPRPAVRGSAPAPVQRLGAGEWIGVFLGLSEGDWSDKELTDYLDLVSTAEVIEGKFHSDNKARAIVARWTRADPAFALTAAQKVLLIQEMIDGPTLIEDETAMVDLLTLSPASELPDIIGPKGVSLSVLEANVDNDALRTRLNGWLEVSFTGGRDAVAKGKVEVAGKDPAKGWEQLRKGTMSAKDAPVRAAVPKEVVDALAEGWKKSFPKGRSKEQGGLWIEKADGSKEWIPATKSTGGSTTLPYDKVPKGARILAAGHTHPYDESEGGHLGVSFSGADLGNIVTTPVPVKLVYAGNRLLAVAKTAEFDALVAKSKDTSALRTEVKQTFDDAFGGASGDFGEKVASAVRAVCRTYHLVLYEGSPHGEVLKMDLTP